MRIDFEGFVLDNEGKNFMLKKDIKGDIVKVILYAFEDIGTETRFVVRTTDGETVIDREISKAFEPIIFYPRNRSVNFEIHREAAPITESGYMEPYYVEGGIVVGFMNGHEGDIIRRVTIVFKD